MAKSFFLFFILTPAFTYSMTHSNTQLDIFCENGVSILVNYNDYGLITELKNNKEFNIGNGFINGIHKGNSVQIVTFRNGDQIYRWFNSGKVMFFFEEQKKLIPCKITTNSIIKPKKLTLK